MKYRKKKKTMKSKKPILILFVLLAVGAILVISFGIGNMVKVVKAAMTAAVATAKDIEDDNSGSGSDGGSTGGGTSGGETSNAASSDGGSRGGGLPIEMVRVGGGGFYMGKQLNPDSNFSDVTPVHTVTLTGFYMGKYEVTQAQWNAVMGDNPSRDFASSDYGVGNSYPVYNVSWYRALVFCNKLSIAAGLTPAYSINGSTDPTAWGAVPGSNSNSTWNAVKIVDGSTGYRLPTEAQWEYAAKGGDTSPGSYTYAGSNNLGDVAWYDGNSGGRTHAVGTKAPNGLGIYDMSGNVWEWCYDGYMNYSSRAQTDPMMLPSVGSHMVSRGGSWMFNRAAAPSMNRFYRYPYEWHEDQGFRVVRPL